MIVYVDTSALVKCYVVEPGSGDVRELIAAARLVGTAVITRVEMAAALAKAVRTGILPHHGAAAALDAFQGDWDHLVRIQLSKVALHPLVTAVIARKTGGQRGQGLERSMVDGVVSPAEGGASVSGRAARGQLIGE